MGKKNNRSNGYQHLFAEQSYPIEILSEFSESQGLVENYNPDDKEELLILKERLIEEFWRIAKENLTKRQLEVITLMSKNYTQIEIAKILRVNQSSITKSLNGNSDYRGTVKGDGDKKSRSTKIRVYGGIRRKMKKIADKDPRVIEILEQMADIHSQYS
jgi:predicted transcriptional regulator